MNIYVNKETGKIAISCCGTISDPAYSLLTANTTDAAKEKHVPVVTVAGDTVTVDVGSVPHPMTEAHLISVIILETTNGYQVRRLVHTDAPKTVFKLADGEHPVAAYEYCNLHGLWVAKI